MELFWFFPTFGDGRFLGTPIGARTITLGYLQQIATALDQLGFAGAFLPTTKRLKFLLGDPEQVAARMREYAELGLETFILSGYPHLEESFRVAELLFPALGLSTPDDAAKRPGEIRGDRRYGRESIEMISAVVPAS